MHTRRFNPRHPAIWLPLVFLLGLTMGAGMLGVQLIEASLAVEMMRGER